MSGIPLAEWRAGGKRWRYREYEIFYRDDPGSGSGTVVCIHGFPTASWDWNLVWNGLRRRFARVLALDMLGFGYSDKPPGHDYSLVDQATLHEQWLAALGVSQAHFLVHDYGVSVAQELLARHEERRLAKQGGLQLESMCFLNGGLFPETHRPRPVQKLLASPLGFLVTRLFNEKRFARSFSEVFGPHTRPGAAELHDFWTLVERQSGQRIFHKLIRYMDERRRQRKRWCGVLRQTKVPLRLVNGPEDPVSGAHMAKRYRELVPNPDVVLLEGIGHYPQVEHPVGVLDAYLAFRALREKT